MLKGIIKRYVSLLLILSMIIGSVPNFVLVANAISSGDTMCDGKIVLESSSNASAWTVGKDSNGVDNCLTGSITTSEPCGGGGYSEKNSSIVLRNTANRVASISFDYVITQNNGFVNIAGKSAAGGTKYAIELEANGTIQIDLRANEGQNKVTTEIKITNMQVLYTGNHDLTCEPVENATYSVSYDGTTYQITPSSDSLQLNGCDNLTTHNVNIVNIDEGYVFYGWIDSTGNVLSKKTTDTLSLWDDTVLKPLIVGVDDPLFSVGTKLFTNLNLAVTSAQADNIDKIILLKSGTIKNVNDSVDYTIPSGISLLLPYEEGKNTISKANADAPYANFEVGPEITAKGQKTVHHAIIAKPNKEDNVDGIDYVNLKLTVDEDVTMDIKGNLVIGGYTSGSTSSTEGKTGQTSGKHSVIDLNGNINVDGGIISTYGYIIGSGNIRAYNNAKIYQPFVITDFRGGTYTTASYDVRQVFPFNSYGFMNIQTPVNYSGGASLNGYCSVVANSNANVLTLPVVGQSGALINYGSSLQYNYSESNGNLLKHFGKSELIVNGGGSFGSINMDIAGVVSLNTASVFFPIPFHYDITIASDGEGDNEVFTLNEGVKIGMLPGSKVRVQNGVEFKVETGRTLAIYDGSGFEPYDNNRHPIGLELLSKGYSERAQFLLDGELEIAGTFGGYIEAGETNLGKVVVDPNAQIADPITIFDGVEFEDKVTILSIISKTTQSTNRTKRELTPYIISKNYDSATKTFNVEKVKLEKGKTYYNTNASTPITGFSFWTYVSRAYDNKGNLNIDIFKVDAVKKTSGLSFSKLDVLYNNESEAVSGRWEHGYYTKLVKVDNNSDKTIFAVPQKVDFNNPMSVTWSVANGSLPAAKTGYYYTAQFLSGGDFNDSNFNINTDIKNGAITITGPTVSPFAVEELEFKVIELPREDTPYKIKYHYMDLEGEYHLKETDDSRVGVTDQNVDITSEVEANVPSGYYLDKNNGNSVLAGKINGDGSLVLNVYYAIPKHNFNVVIDESTTTTEYCEGGTISWPDNPTKKGYIFEGWYTDENFASESKVNPSDITKMGNEDITVYAKLTLEEYTIKYKLDEGGDEVSFGDSYGSYNVNSELVLPTPDERNGYDFNGWKDKSSGEILTEINPGRTNNLELIAQWEAKSYKVIFKVGDANFEGTCKYNEKIEVPSSVDNHIAGYHATNWKYNGEDISLNTFTMPAEDVIISGQWVKNEFSVIFHKNDSTGEESNSYSYTYDDGAALISINELAFGRLHYTFKGWATTPEGDVKYGPNHINTGSEEDLLLAENGGIIHLYAVWEVKTYSIKYNLEDGHAEGLKYSYTVEDPINIQVPNPTKEGYDFVGWKNKSNPSEIIKPLTIVCADGGDREYTAIWEAKQFTVILDKQYGNETSELTVVYNSNYEGLENIERNGYTFGGWYFNAECTGDPVTSVTKVTATQDHKLFAKWTPKTYELTYNGNYAEAPLIDGKSVTFDSAYGELPNPERIGYTFGGWYLDEACTDAKKVTAETLVTTASNHTVYAKWTVKTYKISFNTNGGTTVNPIENVPYGTAYEDILPVVPTKTGYDFVGWYLNENLEEGLITEETVLTTLSDHTLYAKWAPSTNTKYLVKVYKMDTTGAYVVDSTEERRGTTLTSANLTGDAVLTAPEGFTYNGEKSVIEGTIAADGSTVLSVYFDRNKYTFTTNVDGVANSTEYYYEQAITTPETPTKIGYTFKAWSPAVPTTMPKENVEVTATWTANTYALTYDANYTGAEAIEGKTVTYDGTYGTLPNLAGTRTGYTFIGWFLDGVEVESATQVKKTSNHTLVAHWTANSYRVNLVVGEGASLPEGKETYVNVAYDSKYLDVVTNEFNPTKTGYGFVGWYLDEACTEANRVTETTVVENASIHYLYAKFEAETYTITYNANGGSNAPGEQKWTYAGESIVLSNDEPTREGYTFLGWSEEANATEAQFTKGQTLVSTKWSSDKTLYAVWKINTYNVIYKVDGVVKYTDKYNYGSEVSARPAETKTGYTFSGWSAIPNTMPAEDVVVNGTFTANKYQITYDANGGDLPDGTTNPFVATYDAAYGEIVTPTREGYTFNGWYLGETKVEETTLVQTAGNHTLVADWRINSYNVTFDMNGGDDVDELTFNYGQEVILNITPNKTGYTFAGWTTTVPDTMPANDITLTANWTANTYTVTFNGNGATSGGTADQTFTYDAAQKLNSSGFYREGYSFDCWMYDGKEYNTADEVKNLATEGTIELVAKWRAHTYTVRFDGGTGASGSMDDMNFTYDAKQTLTANEFTKVGYHFVGWKVAEIVNRNVEKVYSDEEIVENLTNLDKATVILTAVWEADEYIVTFDTDGGTVVQNATATYDSTYADALPEVNPTRPGYTFSGWYFDDKCTDGNEVTSSTTVTLTNNHTIYAKWTANKYTVTLNPNGGTVAGNVNEVVVTYDELYNLPIAAREGYTFLGWFDGNDNQILNTALVNIITDIEVTAKWAVGNPYSITYDLNEGSWTQGTVVLDEYNVETETFNLSIPVREGYTFLGWTGSNGEEPQTTVTVTKGTTGNLSYTANWKINTYKITFNTNGGSAIGELSFKYGETVDFDVETTRLGYTFGGWDKLIPQKMPANDIELVAQWSINTYKIFYKVDGELKYTDNVVFDSNIIPREDETKVGYTFSGWSGLVDKMPAENITVIGSFTANTYEVTYVTNGGSLPEGTAPTFEVTYDAEYPALKEPTREGYIFGGWYLDAGCTDAKKVADETTVTTAENHSVYAKWTPITYTIKYEANEGTGSIENTTHTFDSLNNGIALGDGIERVGYTFKEWNTKADGTGESYVAGAANVGNLTAENGKAITLYAIWTANTDTKYVVKHYWQNVDGEGYTPHESEDKKGTTATTTVAESKTYEGFTAEEFQQSTIKADGTTVIEIKYTRNEYTLKFNTKGGTTIADITQVYGSKVTKPANPTRDGYTFAGWYNNEALTGEAVNVVDKVPASNITYYAKWDIVTYNIAYTANGVTTNLNYTIESDAIALPNPTKVGYTFLGWTGSNGETPQKDLVIIAGSFGNKTYTANFAANTYKIVFDMNGAVEEQIAELECTFDTTTTLPTTVPTKVGYTFTGWEFGEDVYSAGQQVRNLAEEGSVTLTATWMANQYLVSFDTNGGTDVASNNATYDGTYESVLPVVAPTKPGYTFEGWYIEEEYVEANRVTSETIVKTASAHTLYANWTANTYEVKFNGNGATSGSMDNQVFVYNEDENLNVNTYKKSGYHFIGWATSENGAVVYTEGAKLNVAINAGETVNLYAVWEINKYTVKFNSGLDGVEPVTQLFTNGVEQKLTANSFNKTGYHFVEWVDGNNNKFADKQDVTLTDYPNNAVIELTAVWAANENTEYTVIYKLPNLDGEGYREVTKTYTGTTDTIVDAPFITETGFTEPEVQQITIAADGSASVTYEYTRNQYTVTWNVDGVETEEVLYFGQTILVKEIESKVGHTFKNWTNAEDVVLVAGTKMPASDVMYTANWTVNKYDVTWVVDGNTYETSKKDYGTTIAAPTNPTKIGYTFAGWYSDAELTNKVEDFGTVPANNTTYYCKWDANTDTPYKVEHYQMGIYESDEPILVEIDNLTGKTDSNVKPETKTYTGFITPERQEVTILADGSLIVKYYYTRATYDLVWQINNGIENQVIERIFGQQIYQIARPSKSGYTFNGWYANNNFEGESITTFGTMPAQNVTYYGKWTPITYGISYTMNGGSFGNLEAPRSYTIETDTFVLPSPTKVGYTFIGWTTTDNNTPVVNLEVSKGSYGNKTFIANFEANSYEVIFNGNGSTKGEMTNQTLTYDAELTPLANNLFEKEGYTFRGWSRNADGSGYIYQNAEEVRNLTTDGNITLYACWQVNRYTIKFLANGGIMNTDGINDVYGATIIAPTAPVKTGYMFDGWEPELPSTMPAKDMTLVAKWAPITYTIVFEPGEGMGTMSSATFAYGEAKNLPLNQFTKEGHSFDGWILSNGTTFEDGESILNLTEVNGTEFVLTAKWKANPYTITFDTNGGEVMDPIVQDYGTNIAAPSNPVYKGYRFDGWIDENGNEATIPTVMPATNRTFKATWTSYLDLLHAIPVADFENALTDKEDENVLDVARAYYMQLNDEQIAKYKSEDKYKEHYEVLFAVIKAVSERDLKQAVADAEGPTNNILYDSADDGNPDDIDYGQIATIRLNDNQHADIIINRPDCLAMKMLEVNFLTELFGYEEINGVVINNSTACQGDSFTQFDIMLAIAFETFGKNEPGVDNDPAEFINYLKKHQRTLTIDKLDGYTVQAKILATTPEGIEYTMDYYIDFFNEEHDVVWMMDADVEHTSVSTAFEDEITLPTEPTKAGYTFLGWNTKADGSGTDFVEGTKMGKKAVTYYAQWQVNQYTITFDSNGGSDVDSITADYNADIRNQHPDDPVREGYTFTGWEVTIPDNMPAGDMTIKALWSINSHDLTFDANSGEFAGGEDSVTTSTEYDAVITLPVEPTRTGHTFLGWFDERGNAFIPGTTMPDKAVTYTAKWDVNEYTIKFYSEGVEIDSITADYNADIRNEKPADPTREGYTFAGWDVAIPDNMPAGDMTITATWTINSYNLAFDTNGGVFADGKEAHTDRTNYNVTINNHEEPTRTGYTFIGWFENKEMTGEEVTFPVTMPAANKTYYAGWTANQYEVTLNPAGGIFEEATTSVTVTYDKQFNLPSPKRTGYTFVGWYYGDTKINNTDLVKITENISVVAKWDIGESFDITYDLNGGAWDDGTQVVDRFNVETPTFELETPVKEGYTFLGWTGSNGDTPKTKVTITKGTAKDLEYKANWKINEYTITFNTLGADNIDPITQNFGTDIVAPADPTREGYTFLGWDKEIPETMPAGDMTITARWQVNQYKFTFVTNGGSVVENITADYNADVTVPADPTREGYTFVGWYDNEKLEGRPVEIPTTMPASDKTFYAKWTINQYKITFNTDGGSKIDEITLNYGEAIDLDVVTTKTGYTFKGWDKTVPQTMPAADIELTAIWQVNQYKFTFVTNGGSVVENITADYNADVTVPAAPTREGYTFVGWYDNEKLEGRPVEIPTTMPASDKTFYAKWTINEYKITFDTAGGSAMDELTFNYGEEIVIAGEPTREGYTFNGWDKEVPNKMPANDIKLTAKWSINTYKVFYEVDGEVKYTDYVAYGNPLSPRVNETKTGYTFSGWSEIPGTMPAHDVTITGSFTANNYKVNFDANYPAAQQVASQTVTFASPYGDLPEVTRTGYTLAGWYLDGVKITKNTTVKTAGEHTLIAEWTPNTYKVNLDANGGSVAEEFIEVVYDQTFQGLPTPVLEGYDFVGWFNGEEQITSDTKVQITETITLKARWNAAGDTPYKVEHYQQTLDGKYKLVETEDFTGATEAKVQATQKTYTGFKANLDDSMVEGTVKADGSLVLKMYYDRESYTVVWKVRGTELRETYLYGQTIEVPDTTWADDIHTSHVFTGWDVQIPETVTGNATYTAIYDAKYEASIGDTTYRTLKLALANAKSGETVYLEKDITLTEDITVPTGVSLLIPCMDDDTGYQLVENGRYKFNHDNPTTSSNPVLYRTLTVPEGITLTVNGNVLINSVSGRNSGGTAEMDVTGGYAQINLDGNIIVNGGGSLDCFGFVKGQGSITAEKNATVGDLYVVRHWRGGSQALEMYQSIYEYGDPNNPDERQVYPMNEYDCHNIETDIIIKHGASYEGLVKMNANAGQGTAYYHTRFPQVDVNNGIIRLTNENGYVVRSYDEAGKEETYTIYGGADFAESSLVILGQKVSTKDFLYPIDGDINFVLNAGDYHFKNDYKFLPGGGVTVNNGATLTVDYGTYVAFYDEFHDVKNTGSASNNYTRYPEREATVLYVKEGGKFINAGTFGGSIVTESPDILIGDYPTWGIETLEANGYTNGTVTIPHELKITREGYSWRYGDISLGEVPNSIIWFGANYDALLAAYKTVPDDLDIYSDETAGPLKEVLAEIKWDLGKDKQDKVDEWTKRVTEGVANLELRVVQVTFNAAGGTVDEPTRGVTYGTAYGELPIPEYYGFKFLGWYDEDNMAVTAESVMKLKVNTLVLTAKWEKLPADYTKVTEAIAAIPDDMTGYTAESVMAVYEARDAVDMTLGLADQNKVDAMAQAILDAIDALERVEISVSFDANGGEAITSKLTLRYGDTYPYNELPTPVRDGFEFIGWYTAREGGIQITATSKVTSETDVILYAKWQKEAVTEPADYTAVEEAMAKIPANLKPYTAASVNKLQAAVDAVIPGLMIDRQGDVDAWAKAIEEAIEDLTYKTITVYLDPGDGECDTKTINVTYGTAITKLPSANKTYCDFLGWFTAKEGGEKVEAADLTYKTDNLTIYAQYKLRDADYSRIEEIKAMIPTDLDGYSYESVTRLNNALAQIEPGYTADKQSLVNRWADELYDAYTKLAYKTVILTFDVQHEDAKVSPKTLEVQYKGTIQILPTPTLTHYTFMGWFTEPEGGVEVKVGDEITSTSDFSIYARWAQLDADYSKVEAAIAKIPQDVEKYYTAESVAKLQAALDAVEYGLHQGYQEQIDKWAGNIEVARQQLVGKSVTVRFDSQGGSAVMARAIPYGKNYTFPANPTRDGYTFEGWYTDTTYATKVTTADKVQTLERHTLYARWIGGPADYTVVEKAIANIPSDMTNGHYTEESVKRVQDAVNAVEYGLKIEEQGKINAWAIEIQEAIDALEKKGCTGDYISPNCPSKHFGDVDQHMWYHADVDYVVEKGIMNGTSATTFEPSEETTRGMIVTMLYRMSGEKVTKQELAAMKFNDVYQNDYYYEAVAWAASKGVVNGTSATTFDPMDNITREQMVAMLFRYANYLDYDTDERAELGGFVDAIKVSGYAVDAVKWANAEGLLNGFMNSDGTYEIRPEGFTTRDQAAAFIHRFCVKFVETDDK